MQWRDWTCSACTAAWVLRSLGAPNPECNQDQVIAWLGPNEISPDVGLWRGDHSGLVENVYEPDYYHLGLSPSSKWVESFDALYELAQQAAPLQLSGAAWYHHSGVRGVLGEHIWLANPAPGYMGVFDTLDRSQYARLGGWRVTRVVP